MGRDRKSDKAFNVTGVKGNNSLGMEPVRSTFFLNPCHHPWAQPLGNLPFHGIVWYLTPCYSIPCYGIPCYGIPYYGVSGGLIPWYILPWYWIPCSSIPRFGIPCDGVLCGVIPWSWYPVILNSMLYYSVSWYSVWLYSMLWRSICRVICFPCCSFLVELFREISSHIKVLCVIVCHVRVFHVVVILIPFDCVPFYSIPYYVLWFSVSWCRRLRLGGSDGRRSDQSCKSEIKP